jgi:hypothetical protein
LEPCAFCHYFNVNIHETTLLEALQSPLFMEYHKGIPFNENMLRPCPLLDNPEKIVCMVNNAKAKSTDMKAPEAVEDLAARTEEAAIRWAQKAAELNVSRCTSS